MAWIEKRKNRFAVRWREEDKVLTQWASTKDEAKLIKAELELALLNGSYVAQESRRQIFLSYMENVYAGDLSLREVTRSNYESVLKVHLTPRLKDVAVEDLNAARMRKLFADISRDSTPWVTRMAYRMVSRVVRQAMDEGLLTRDPLAGVKVPTPQRRAPRVLTPAEVQALADRIDQRYRAVILLSAWGGLAIGEIGGLRREDLDFDRCTVTVARAVSTPHGRPELGPPKAASRKRTVSIPQWVMTELAEHLLAYPGEYVFTTPSGGIVTHLNIRRAFQAAKPECRLHDLRHTAVAILIQDGAHPKLIQSRMGHSSITMTLDVYGSLFPTADADLASSLEKYKPKDAEVISL